MTPITIFDKVSASLNAAGLTGDWITPDDSEMPGSLKGAYVLLIRLDRPLPVRAGRLRAGTLPPGTYLYAGSAYGAGGLAARIRRHFRKDKKIHWHIDRLTLKANSLAAFPVAGGNECQLVGQLLKTEGIEIALEGFGSTDCRTCRSHLLAAF